MSRRLDHRIVHRKRHRTHSRTRGRWTRDCAQSAAAWTPPWPQRWCHRAIGDRLTGVFVNNGLLRKNEFEKVLSILQNNLHLNVRGVDASDRFLNMLAGVTDPEKKRKIIGEEFIRVFEEEATRRRSRRFSRPGNALSGRHRIGFRQRDLRRPSSRITMWVDCRNACD